MHLLHRISDAALFAAQSGYKKITETVKAVRKRINTAGEGEADKKITDQLKQLREKFEAAMNDDLNTSIALSVVFELVRLANKLLEEKTTAHTFGMIDVLFGRLGGDCLGIVKDEYPQPAGVNDEIIERLINVFIEQRSNARKRKDFVAADATRATLDAIGIVLKDMPEGTTEWEIKTIQTEPDGE